tara:strand:+ start:421 stop:2271 length:1851 start_codon:yes stop_codon:yes gene_type:complete
MSGIFKKFKRDDIQLTPYEAHKTYLIYFDDKTGSYYERNYEQSVIKDHTYTSSATMWIGNVSLSAFVYDAAYDATNFIGDEIGRYSEVINPSTHLRTTNGFYQRSIFSSIEKMYYTNPDNSAWTLHNTDQARESRNLESTAQVLSIPQRMFGDAIEKKSLHIHHAVGGGVSIKDDGFGNLYDADITQYNLIPNRVLYLNFAGLHKEDGKVISAHSKNEMQLLTGAFSASHNVNFFERSRYDNFVEAYNIRPKKDSVEGSVVTFTGLQDNTNTAAASASRQDITQLEAMRIMDNTQFNWRDEDDWSIYLRVSCSLEQPSSGSTIAPNDGYLQSSTLPHKHSSTILSKFDTLKTPRYPFYISYGTENYSTNKIVFKCSDGTTTKQALSSALPAGYNDILIRKTGTTYTLGLNSIATGFSVFSGAGMGKTSNDGDITAGLKAVWLGRNKLKSAARFEETTTGAEEFFGNFKGGISDIQLFDKHLTDDEATFLLATNNSGVIGNVFYKHGLATITDLDAKYANAIANCTMSFNNTHTIFENEYACHIKEKEFGFTMNSSLIDDTKFGTVKHFVTRSEWSPYITSIGLYDDHMRLLAIGKLSQPLRKSNDYDTSFIVKFDS